MTSTTTWRHVAFAGGTEAAGPITWGQQTTWDDMAYFLPDSLPFFVIKQLVPVPAGLCVDDVLAELAELVRRHDSLRTHFVSDGDGRVTQQSVGAGSLRVAVRELAAPPVFETLREFALEVAGLTFDHAAELPGRYGIACWQGSAHTVAFGISHAAVDMQGATLVSAELTDLLLAKAAGAARPVHQPTVQPVQLAAWEASDKGQRRNTAALAHLRKQLDVVAPTMFADPTDGESPRYWRGCLESRAVPLALRALDSRYRVGPSAILLATTVLLLDALTAADAVTLGLVFGNRSTAEIRTVVGCLSETVVTTVQRGSGSFADLVSRAWSTSMRSYMHGRFDDRAAAVLTRDIGQSRGISFDLNCRFNDTWSWRVPDKPEGAVIEAATVREALADSVFSWPDKTDLDKITFYVDIGGDAERIRLNLLADTRRVPAASMQAFLVGMEAALVALVERDLCLDHVVTASGLRETPFLGRPGVVRSAASCSCGET